MWGHCGVREVRSEGIALCGSCGVGELRCGDVAVWVCCSLGELRSQCVEYAVFWSRDVWELHKRRRGRDVRDVPDIRL